MIELKVNGVTYPVKPTKFPDGTSQVWKLPATVGEYYKIDFIWEKDESEIMGLFTLIDLIRSDNPLAYIYLHMPYLPYARQDKEISNHTTFALHTFANLLNSKQLNIVTSFDVHSKVAKRLIKNFQSITPEEYHYLVHNDFKPDVTFYPDAGAAERYSVAWNEILFFGEKVRNQLTGAIEGYKLVNKEYFELKNKRVLIIDDLCDGGATFITAAKALKEAGAGEIGLCVSHGVFSKGLIPLENAGISKIYYTDSIVNIDLRQPFYSVRK